MKRFLLNLWHAQRNAALVEDMLQKKKQRLADEIRADIAKERAMEDRWREEWSAAWRQRMQANLPGFNKPKGWR